MRVHCTPIYDLQRLLCIFYHVRRINDRRIK